MHILGMAECAYVPGNVDIDFRLRVLVIRSGSSI